MNRRIRSLGLLLGAVLASAACAAPATAAEFHSELAHTTFSGFQVVGEEDAFTFKAGVVRCSQASYSGTSVEVNATFSEITLTPKYTNCTAFGFVNTPIDVPKSCDFRFTPSTAATQLHLICGANEYIEVTAFNCHVQIGSQTGVGITYHNKGTGVNQDIMITSAVTGMTYTQASKVIPGCQNGTFTDGKFAGATTLSGTTGAGEPVGIWHQ
jgi:hypothetical protein